MSSWKEQEWRIPRKEEVVIDEDGNLGRVLRSEGSFTKRILWIANEFGTEIHSGVDAEKFKVVNSETIAEFQHRRFNHMGYEIGSLCCFKGNIDIPLEILQMDWSNLRFKMTFCLKDLREFDGDIMMTDDISNIPIIDLNLPDKDNIFTPDCPSMRYKLQINLIETDNIGWTNTGSPWEFNFKEDALLEIERWKSSLKIRRLASAINADWKLCFPSWIIESIKKEDKILTRVRKIESFSGSTGYFKTALHASHAIKMIESENWLNILYSSQDNLNF